MIGCIGTAPAEGSASTFMPAYPFGGNMDLREMEPGTTLYLPVNVPGGLLSMGDLHAAMGTAEPTWVSLEAAGQATLRIGVEKGLTLAFPRLRCAGEIYFLGIAIAERTPRRTRWRSTRRTTYLIRDRGMSTSTRTPTPAPAATCGWAAGQHIVMAMLPEGAALCPLDCGHHERRRERARTFAGIAADAHRGGARARPSLRRTRSSWLATCGWAVRPAPSSMAGATGGVAVPTFAALRARGRSSAFDDDEDEYTIRCDCGGESWCAWPNCVAVPRGPVEPGAGPGALDGVDDHRRDRRIGATTDCRTGAPPSSGDD